MTDLDALKREAEAAVKRMHADATGNPGGYCTGHDLRAYVDLIQRLLPALEDARRYRWLREQRNPPAALWRRFSVEEFDAAIDSAMEKGR